LGNLAVHLMRCGCLMFAASLQPEPQFGDKAPRLWQGGPPIQLHQP
jgi:hypothetical protein